MENLNSEQVKKLKNQGKKLLVDYYAKWCGPCKSLIPRLELIEKEYDYVTFVKVDVDENKDSLIELSINSVPTVMIYDGNTLVERLIGANPDYMYKDILNKL